MQCVQTISATCIRHRQRTRICRACSAFAWRRTRFIKLKLHSKMKNMCIYKKKKHEKKKTTTKWPSFSITSKYIYILMIFSTDFTVCTQQTQFCVYYNSTVCPVWHTVRMPCTFIYIYLPYYSPFALCMAMALLECKMKCILYFIVATMYIYTKYWVLAHIYETPACVHFEYAVFVRVLYIFYCITHQYIWIILFVRNNIMGFWLHGWCYLLASYLLFDYYSNISKMKHLFLYAY